MSDYKSCLNDTPIPMLKNKLICADFFVEMFSIYKKWRAYIAFMHPMQTVRRPQVQEGM
jgi:hypothetical protein